ncbi:MAG: carboxypeptidase regulatory-like domain-containing protein [Kofleriaceae bacterium]
MKRFLVLAILVVGCAHNSGNSGADGGSDVPPGCGDGVIGGAEQCDDGNNVDGDGCSHDCMLEDGHTATCGDGILEAGEGCDDGNTVGDDGCSAVCQSESSGLPCTAHTFRCGPSGDVEVCNNAGTAWQYVSTCSTGCNGGACTDPTCQAGTKRCHGETVETCNAAGSGWDVGETCTTYCASGQCALDGLNVGTNSNYDGEVIVAGDLVVSGNSTLTSSTGDLTIIADNIRVEAGAAIAAAPTGVDTRGASCYYGYPYYTNFTSNYGQAASGYMEQAWGGEQDAAADRGAVGGANGSTGCAIPVNNMISPTHGGGRIRLIAKHDVTIAGQLLASGENAKPADHYGGSGGGIQIAGDTIEITGSISTAGGTYGSTPSGNGRVRLLYGSTLMNTGTIIGTVTQGRRPPIDLTSPTQPDPTLTYNDNFTKFTVTHERPFDTAQGYLHTVDTTEHLPPVPAQGTFTASESFDVDATEFTAGANWVHIAAIDANSTLGTVESRFPVTINTTAPTASSTSHISPTTWYDNPNPYFAWTNPQSLDDKNFKRFHYVLDHFGDTIPTVADTSLVTSQKQLLVSNLAAGIWVLHVISEDTMGHLTKKAAHVVVRVGTDPGSGSVFGSVFDENNHPVSGATVRVNRGLFTATTNAQGSYTVTGVAAGTWEISVVYVDHNATAQQLTVTTGQMSSANFTLAHN